MAEESDFFAKIDAVDAAMTDLVPLAVGRGAEHVRTVAIPLTPLRDGDLRAGAGVTVHGDEAHLTFKGPYARRQHFELDWKHTTGQALYLEQPMRTEADAVIQIMSDTLGEAF